MQSRCPRCQAQLRVLEELPGRRVKGPKCGAVFQVGQTPVPAAAEAIIEEIEEQPEALARTKKKGRQAGFCKRTVRDSHPIALAVIACPCCAPFWLVPGIVGSNTFRDAEARDKAKLLAICAGIAVVLGCLGTAARFVLMVGR